MKLSIMGIEGARYVLSRPHDYTHVISIGTPCFAKGGALYRPTKEPYELPDLSTVPNRLQLHFDDMVKPAEEMQGYTLPNEEHVQQLIDFAEALAGHEGLPHDEDAHLLVHCHAGVSRSTATAYIALATMLGPGQERKAFLGMLTAQTMPWPNMLMVEIADRLLKRHGDLVRELQWFRARKNGQPYHTGYR